MLHVFVPVEFFCFSFKFIKTNTHVGSFIRDVSHLSFVSNVRHFFSPLSSGECFPQCASKCAIWSRASSIISQWTSCRLTPNAIGECIKTHKLIIYFFYFFYLKINIYTVGRYVYHSSQWMVAGNTDHSCISPRLYVHPDSPCAGETWMRQVISFDRIKLTNNEMDDKGHVGNPTEHERPPLISACSACRRPAETSSEEW